jgi:uncharacterized protein YkwD
VRRTRCGSGAIAVGLALVACGPRHVPADASAPAARDASPRDAALARDVLAHVNRHRREHGLDALAPDARVDREARAHSVAMATHAVPVGHAGFDDRVHALRRLTQSRRFAENVAVNRGYGDPASEAVRGWLASRGHRQNIEGPYQATGVGVASDAAGNVYFTQIFVGR